VRLSPIGLNDVPDESSPDETDPFPSDLLLECNDNDIEEELGELFDCLLLLFVVLFVVFDFFNGKSRISLTLKRNVGFAEAVVVGGEFLGGGDFGRSEGGGVCCCDLICNLAETVGKGGGETLTDIFMMHTRSAQL